MLLPIVEICRLRAWRAEELAILLQRHSRYVRNNCLRPLMRDGGWCLRAPAKARTTALAFWRWMGVKIAPNFTVQ